MVDTVVSVPVVGGIVSGIGLDDVVTGVVDTVDETLPVIVGTAPSTDSIVPALPGGGTLPGEGLEPSTPAQADPLAAVFVPAPATASAALPAAAPSVIDPTAARVEAAAEAFAATATSSVPGHTSAHGTTPPTEAPAGYGLGDGIPGSSSASLSSAAGGPTAARLDDRAGSPTFVLLFRSALVDDDLPGAPTFATDVSPD